MYPCPQAFNNAFLSIGMDCVTWTPPIYNDLLGCCDGTGEGLITAYYTTGGCHHRRGRAPQVAQGRASSRPATPRVRCHHRGGGGGGHHTWDMAHVLCTQARCHVPMARTRM